MAHKTLTVQLDVAVPLPDGTTLRADVYRSAGTGPTPALLVRTPYGKRDGFAAVVSFGIDPIALAGAGYAVVVQDVRGAFASAGQFRQYHDEAADGAASIAWLVDQEWCDGSVGMVGVSYFGATQLLAATQVPNGLKAISPSLTGSDCYDGWTYQGGALQLGFTLHWACALALVEALRRQSHGADVSSQREQLEGLLSDPWTAYNRLPLIDLPQSLPLLSNYGEWLAHPDRDDFWRANSVRDRYSAITVPALHIAGWNDIFLGGSLENYVGLRAGAGSAAARDGQRLIVGPWSHTPPVETVGDVWFGTAASPPAADVVARQQAFFASHLLGASRDESAPVRLFVMGPNRWRDEDDWPLSRANLRRLYLREQRKLSFEPPGDEPADEFLYDPADPVPTLGGNTLMPGGGLFTGPRDRRSVQSRPDVLVFRSDPLTQDVEVTGPVEARLHVATSARDTDFTVALTDVHPDGRILGITDGILRMRYREGHDTQVLGVPGETYDVTVDLVATSFVFGAGHRIGIEVSSSNFPRYDRNPNHGGNLASATERDFVVARQSVFHDSRRQSYVALPVVTS
jgi:putative CocE/NonD family hydrolase